MSPKKWIEATDAVGIVSKSGRYGEAGLDGKKTKILILSLMFCQNMSIHENGVFDFSSILESR